MQANTKIPPAPLVLGLGGLVPFVVLTIVLLLGWGDRLPIARPALLTYGAVIASFLGGIRWGLALREADSAARFDLALSVVPSLLAWGCLALPRPFDLAGLAALILAWGFIDRDLPRRGLAPPWFGRLRLLLSTIAGLTLAAAALGT
ncbi:MAG: DUF3429 domain-containing protein [Methylobacteriaceae bacterium]|nr:DUF3429 domain-containing protein [Methylobacteriaceae bacterium]